MSNYAPAVEYAVMVIECMAAEHEPIGIADLSRKLDLNKNMIFRILNSLEKSGWVYCESIPDKKYSLTLRPFEITSKVRNRLTLNNVATPLIYELWKKTGENTCLGIRNGDKVMYIQHFDSTKTVRVASSVGGMYDLYCSAPGKVILAYSSDDYLEKYMSRTLKKMTRNTITEKNDLLLELQKVKKEGFAIDNEEYGNGILCFAAPIFDNTEGVIGAVGSSVSTIDFSYEEAVDYLKPLITNTAKEISERFGYQY